VVALFGSQAAQRDGAQPPLAGASFAAEFNVEVIFKLLIRTASGWLERLVRPHLLPRAIERLGLRTR
jgi:hypothetical protein